MNAQEQELQQFLKTHEAAEIPLFMAYTQSAWDLNNNGTEENQQRAGQAQTAYKLFYSDKQRFEQLQAISGSGMVQDTLLKRQMELVLNSFKSQQLPEDLIRAITTLEVQVENKFNVFRGQVGGKEVTQNQINEVLRNSTNSEVRRQHWEAQKAVGAVLAGDLRQLVALRNRAARHLGYPNYYDMSLGLQEIDRRWLLQIFDDLYQRTEASFLKAKAEIDAFQATRFGINPEEIMPWHYADPFFQSSPRISTFDYNAHYDKADIIKLAQEFYQSIGLSIGDILKRSDMFERKGKCPHAFCCDMDKAGDVRILMNVEHTVKELETMLHEAGHGVYDLGINPSLPFVLRDPAHTFTTEAVAMMMGKLAYTGRFMKHALGIDEEQASMIDTVGEKTDKYNQLVFSRWAQVMVRFEAAMYENPDQNLNKLWWDLVEKYQHVPRPAGRDAPDFASKIHLCVAPIYYQNYQLGELFATQMHSYIMRNITNGAEYHGHPEVGQYLSEKVFLPGASMKWDELVKHATGEELTAKYFAVRYT